MSEQIKKKKVAILGSSGSIGTQALEVIEEQSHLFEVEVLTVYKNAELLIEQAKKFRPNAVVIVDGQYEDTAIKEATSMGIPVVAIIDSNTDPNKISYPIPANDDSLRTIQLLIGSIADAILEIKSSKKDDNNMSDTNPKLEQINIDVADKDEEE